MSATTFNELKLDDLTPEALAATAELSGAAILSIALPTERSGARTQQGAIRLKNALSQADEQCKAAGRDTAVLETLRPLTEHDEFWQHQSQGLAIFAVESQVRMFRVDRSVEEVVRLDNVPWLLPLVTSVSQPGSYYSLAVSWEEANLYRCDSDQCQRIEEDGFPATFRQLVTPRDPEEQLQYSSHQAVGNRTGTQEAMYHGQGEGERKREADRLNYLKRVAELAASYVYNQKQPLVLVATDEVAGHLDSATDLEITTKVAGSPDELSPQELQQRSRSAVSEKLSLHVSGLRERFGDARAQGRGSAEPEQIVEAASQGRVDTLLVPENEQTGQVELPDAEISEQINRAVVETLRNSGQVYAVPASELPPDAQSGAAVFRY